MTVTPRHEELSMLDRRTVCLLGLPFDVLTLAETVDQVRAAIAHRQPCWLSTPNLNFLIAATRDPEFRRTVLLSELSVADGMPVIWLARLLGLPLRERVAGSDVFEALHQGSPSHPVKAYFFGGPEGAAESACRIINQHNSGLRCVGFQSPGFGSLESMSTDRTLQPINEADPDFLVVSLGAQRGQAWIERNRHRLAAPVIGPLGAVVNFEARTVRRAPPLWRRTGLEWLWRILQEPALWRRYATDATALVPMLWRQILPLCWARLRANRSGHSLVARVDTAADGSRILRLAGDCTAQTLDQLRPACRQALSAGGALQIDMSAVSELDAEGMGLLLLVQGLQMRHGQPCQVRQASPMAHRRLQQHGCADLLVDEGATLAPPYNDSPP